MISNPCPSGTYNDKRGSINMNECKPCPPMTFSNEGQMNCTPCDQDTFSYNGWQKCLPKDGNETTISSGGWILNAEFTQNDPYNSNNPLFFWEPIADGYLRDETVGRTNLGSLKCVISDNTTIRGAYQSMEIISENKLPFFFSAYSKSEGVDGISDSDYSVKLRLFIDTGKFIFSIFNILKVK